eukprot:SAG31_NODE_14_length_37953_cov_109.719660_8_plen_138_part_00
MSDSSQAQFGGRRDFKPIFMSVPENVTKRGSMFKCPTDWGLDRVDPPTFLWALVACEVLETAMCQQLITFISSVQSGADLSDSNAFLRVVVSSPVLSPGIGAAEPHFVDSHVENGEFLNSCVCYLARESNQASIVTA